MTDYYIGIIVGGVIGYGLSLSTMIFVWSLCVVSAKADRRAGGIKLAEARNEFMDVVYDELSDDADNCRANRIIDAADEIYEVLHRSGEE